MSTAENIFFILTCASWTAIAVAFISSDIYKREQLGSAKATLFPISVSLLLSVGSLILMALTGPDASLLLLLIYGVNALAAAATAVYVWYLIVTTVDASSNGDAARRDEFLALSKELDENRRKLRALGELSGDWIWQTNERGEYVYISDGIRKVLGYGPEEFVGRSVDRLFRVDPNAPEWTSHSELMSQKAAFRDYTYRSKTARGDEVSIRVSGLPWFDSDNVFRGHHGFATDFTPQQQLQEARAASRAKESFMTAISHEIRTPLNGVLGLLEILRDTPLNDDQLKLVSTAAGSGETLLSLINDLLDFSKIRAGHFDFRPEPVRIADTISETCEQLRALAGKAGNKIIVKISPDVPAGVLIDKQRYRQILINLIGNATKFTRDGTITVALDWVADEAHTGWMKTSVTDTGVGIPDDKQALIFNEFTMLDHGDKINTKGTGLGLALCNTLTTLMGGRIGVTSKLGTGSTFWFDLKLSMVERPPLSKHETAQHVSGQTANRSLRILLAEDNKTNTLVATRMLVAAGHTVTAVENGQLAVDAVNDTDFDVVLMDVSMPVLDGIEATIAIREIEKRLKFMPIPIIALSAHAGQTERGKMLAAGMNSCLSKPVRRPELLAELQKWLLPVTEDRRGPASKLEPHTSAAQTTATKPDSSAPVSTVLDAPFPKSGAVTLNTEVLRRLAEETSEDAIPHLIDLFCEEVNERAKELVRARETNNIRLLTTTCHAIAGSSTTVGAERLFKICKKLETTCRETPDPKYFALVDVVTKEIDAVVIKLKAAA